MKVVNSNKTILKNIPIGETFKFNTLAENESIYMKCFGDYDEIVKPIANHQKEIGVEVNLDMIINLNTGEVQLWNADTIVYPVVSKLLVGEW